MYFVWNHLHNDDWRSATTSIQLLCGVVIELKLCQQAHICIIFANTSPNMMHPPPPQPPPHSSPHPNLNLENQVWTSLVWGPTTTPRQDHSPLLLHGSPPSLIAVAREGEMWWEIREDAVFWGRRKSVRCPKYQRVRSAVSKAAVFYNQLVFDGVLCF